MLRGGLRARADPRLDPAPLLGRRAQLRAAARDRRAAGLLHAAVLRVAADDPPGARRRGRDAHVAGEQRDRGRNRVRGARSARRSPARSSRSSARRTSSTSTRRRTSSRSCWFSSFVPRRKPVAATAQHGVLAGLRFLAQRPAARRRWPRRSSRSASSARACRRGSRCTRTTSSTGGSWIAGLFYAALGAGAVVGSVLAVLVVRKVATAPARRRSAILAFSIPLWVLPFLPPWPVVFAALFAATLFTPLSTGPIIGVLTARTPEALRAKVMTAVDLGEHARGAARLPRRRSGARALGRGAALRRRRRSG